MRTLTLNCPVNLILGAEPALEIDGIIIPLQPKTMLALLHGEESVKKATPAFPPAKSRGDVQRMRNERQKKRGLCLRCDKKKLPTSALCKKHFDIVSTQTKKRNLEKSNGVAHS